jgi:hypothetical protein
VKSDAFSPDYQDSHVDGDAYSIYCAVFDRVHGLETLATQGQPDVKRK